MSENAYVTKASRSTLNLKFLWLVSLLPLKVLYHCPGLREGVKKLYELAKTRDKTTEESDKGEEVKANKHLKLF